MTSITHPPYRTLDIPTRTAANAPTLPHAKRPPHTHNDHHKFGTPNVSIIPSILLLTPACRLQGPFPPPSAPALPRSCGSLSSTIIPLLPPDELGRTLVREWELEFLTGVGGLSRSKFARDSVATCGIVSAVAVEVLAAIKSSSGVSSFNAISLSEMLARRRA